MTITNISVFRSTDTGVGSTAALGRYSGTAGDAVGLLNMLLLGTGGYNWQELTPANLTQSGNVATVSQAAHGFNVDQRAWIIGMDQVGYLNGSTYGDAVYFASVADASHFTFPVTGSPTSPATAAGSTTANGAISSTAATSITLTSGASFPNFPYVIKIDSEYMLVTAGFQTTTPTVRRGMFGSTAATHLTAAAVTQKILMGVAPAGGATPWTADFTAANKSTYRPPAGNRMYLDVDDSGTQTFQVRGYETMSAVATGTGAFPTTVQVAAGSTYVSKSTTASTAARPWVAVATDRGLFLWTDPNNSITNPSNNGYLAFTDLVSVIKSGDAYATILMYDASAGASGNNTNLSGSPGGAQTSVYMPRSYTQTGSSIQAGKAPADGRAGAASSGATSQLTYPHPPDGGLYLTQTYVCESSAIYRGILPFYWHIMHSKPAIHMDTLAGNGAFAGKKFMFVNIYNTVQCALEISNTTLNG